MTESVVQDQGLTEGGIGSTASSATVDTFDVRRPDRIAKSQVRAIQMLHENFVRSVISSLSAYLRTYVSMNLVSIEQLSYGEFLERLPSTTCMACLGLQPYDGSAILEINPCLIFPILEILLGGNGKVATEIEREVTEIEQTLMNGLFGIIAHDLREAWKNVTPIEFEVLSVGTQAQLLQTMAPIEAVLAVKIEVRLGESIGSMNIALPSMVINMMRQKFDHERSARKSEASAEDQARVLELIKASRVKLDGRLPGQQIRVKNLLLLQVGDVLAFDFLVDTVIDVVLNGELQFKGTVVCLGKKRGIYLNGAATP